MIAARIIVLALLSAQSPAEADEPTAAPPADSVAARRESDAAIDRNILLPSAEIGPAGEITFNSYELILAGLSYGFTDRTQGTLTLLLPITTDIPLLITGSLKYVLSRSTTTVVSIMPTLMVLKDGGSDLFIGTFGGGILADRVLDAQGKFALTGSLFAHFGFGKGGTDADLQAAEGVVILGSGAFTARLGRHVKLLTEIILPGGYSWAGSSNRFDIVEQALIFGYGVRFFGSSIGVDLTFLRPLHPDVDTGGLLMGVPWVAFSGRF